MTRSQTHEAIEDRKIDGLLTLIPTQELSADRQRSIVDAMSASLQPVKRLPATGVLVTRFAATFVLLAGVLIAVMGVVGFRSLDAWQAFGTVGVLTLGILLLSLSLAWQLRPGSRERIPSKYCWTILTAAVLGAFAVMLPWRGTEALLAQGWPCLLAGLVVAVPTAVLFFALARRGVPLSAGTYGGTLGAIAGLLGFTMLQFRCIYQDAGHVLFWHGAVLAGSIAAGYLIGRTRRPHS
jgi:hypothetical protein